MTCSQLSNSICAAALLVLAQSATASPIGTPVANAPHGGKGLAIGLGRDRRAEAPRPDAAAEPAASAAVTPDRPLRRHRTAAEWRRDYIARHHHDLPSLRHPS